MRRELIHLLLGCLVLGELLPSVTNAELIGLWQLDGNAADSSGYNHPGTVFGSPRWVAGKIGGAMQFDGEDDWIEVPGTNAAAGFAHRGELTWAAWIKKPGLSGRTTIICQGPSGAAHVIGNKALSIEAGGTVTVRANSVAAALGFTTSLGVADDQWHHVAATFAFEKNGINDSIKVYIDGDLGNGYETDTVNINRYRAVATEFIILIGNNIGGPWVPFTGLMDDVRIYDHALSEEEIIIAMEGGDSEPWPYAYGPEPEDGAMHPETWAQLSWISGSTADSHDVYFGESFTDVTDGSGGTFRGNQRSTSLVVGLPGSPYPDGLVPGTTYYWRVDDVEADGVTTHRGSVWSFFVSSGKAHHPDPTDGAKFVGADVTLSWQTGLDAKFHTVYFGDDFDDVNNATGGSNQVAATYRPGPLEFAKTYYWRVDEFEGGRGGGTHRGDVWSFTTRPPELSSAAFYYVDAGSPDAADINPGTEALPFKTIGKGSQSLQPGDVLLIKAGTYRETVILSKSGTQGNPIQIWAYPGDEGKVIIDAAEPVTHWLKCTGPGDCDGNPYWEHIYVADVAAPVQSHPRASFAIRQVFQHGELLNRSRYPDVGWSYPTAITDPKTKFIDDSLSKSDGYFVGSVCHVKTNVGHIDQIPITDFSQREITLAKSPRFDISTRFGYYITSIVGEINEEGEWAYDPARKKIFLWPRGDVADGVEFSYRNYCVRAYDGTSWNIVRGLTMRNAYRHGVWLYHANDMTIENNTIEHAFTFGISLETSGGVCNNNRILNNAIKHSCFRGISVGRDAWHCRVEGNYIYATGTEHYGGDLMNGPSHAVFINGPFARVYNNRIDRTGHKALYLGGDVLGREVSHNYITNVGLALTESGAMYMGSLHEGPEKDRIHHNIIVNVFGCRMMDRMRDKGLPVTVEKYSGGAPGIYVDERGNNRILEHNTVINSHQAGIFFHWAPGNVVRNNTLYGNKKAQIFFSGRDQPGERIVDEVVLDNIMFATDAQQKTLYLAIDYDDVHFGQSDRNYFYNPFSYWHIFASRYSGEWIQDDLSLQRWRALSGYDANSRELSYLDQFEDITIDPQKESRIIYNPSLDVIDVDLESDKYCDVQGNKISGTVTLQPFESKILIPCDF